MKILAVDTDADALNRGADGYILKPISKDKLLSYLRENGGDME